MAKIVRVMKREVLEAAPYEAWNEYIQIIGLSKYDDLTPIQQVPYLVFKYESEVQNGGHMQYFENRGTDMLDKTIEALGILGAHKYKEILEQAGRQRLSKPRKSILSIFSYIRQAREGEYDRFDDDFYSADPNLVHYLQKYLDEHFDEFIEVQ